MRRGILVGIILLLLFFSGCVQQSNNVYMSYKITGADQGEPFGITVEKTGEFIHITQVENYVCCANITLTLNTTNKTIKIYEENVGEMCKCPLPFKADIFLYNATGYKNVEIYGIKYKDIYDYELLYNYSLEEKTPQQFCDAENPCPEGKECYKFEEEEKPICWEGDPCERCPSGKCTVLESYPMQVKCITGSEQECYTDSDCIHIPSCCHPNSAECVPKSMVKEYPNCKGVACTMECRGCTECKCNDGKCETIPVPTDGCC